MIESLSEPVAWAIVHSLWQGVGIAGLLAIGLFLLRRQSASLRYALSCGAMLLTLVMFISTARYLVSSDPAVHPAAPQERAVPVVTETGTEAPVISSVPVATGSMSAAPIVESLKSGLPYVSRIWAVCVVLLSLYHLSGWSRARNLTKQSITELTEVWPARFKRLCADLGVTGHIRLAESALAKVPCVVGWLRPVILLPASMLTGLTTEQLEMILAHELAHIRRHDVLVNYVQTVIETLMFFNPAIWWISHQIRQERENCCDDFAVRVRGNRLTLAKALTDMEELKMRPSLAVAAGGGSLSKRVRRLVGLPPEARRLPRIGAASLFTLAMVIGMALSPVGPWTAEQALAQDERTRDDDEDIRIHRSWGDWKTGWEDDAKPSDGMRGEWAAEWDNEHVRMEIDIGRYTRSTFSVDREDWPDPETGEGVRFRLVRDAGTFYFEGLVEEDRRDLYGEGDCWFVPSDGYVDELNGLGFRVRSDRRILELAIHNVTLDFVRGLDEAGYSGFSLDRLVELRIHGVTPRYVKELADLGYDDLPLQRLVEMRIHRVTPEYISGISEQGLGRLRPEELVEMRIHRVDPGYVDELAELGYTDFSNDKLVEMRIHRVTPRFIRSLQKLGYDDISPSKLVEMRIHNVDPDYIEELAELGYTNLSPSKLVEMNIHNVGIRFIRELKELGYDDLSPSRLVEFRIHNVTPAFIRKLQKEGIRRLTPSKLVEMRIHGW